MMSRKRLRINYNALNDEVTKRNFGDCKDKKLIMVGAWQ